MNMKLWICIYEYMCIWMNAEQSLALYTTESVKVHVD